MPKKNLIDAAYRRGKILNAVLLQARERAKANPLDNRWIESGILGAGETKEDALKIINETFDELSEYLAYMTILGMAASFEQSFKSKLSNHIGEVRKRVKTTPKNDTLPAYREKLVHSGDDFQGLNSLKFLLDGYVGFDFSENFAALRQARNDVAHGHIERGMPKIDVDTARSLFNDLYEFM